MDLLGILQKHAEADRRQRFRDKRAFYASSALSCLREQYWEATGVKPTDKTDFLGQMKMSVGTAVEQGLVSTLLNDLHWYGIHLLGTQIPVGGSNPSWDGYLDALLAFKDPTAKNGGFRKHVIEIKTKSGYGADLLRDNFTPSDEYLAQLGLYLKDLSEKGITDEGSLLYVLLSDKNFGKLVRVTCQYDASKKEIVALSGSCSDGGWQELNIHFSIDKVLKRWQSLEQMIAAGICPPADYVYKYPLTSEFLESQSDANLQKALKGIKVLGDWQIAYSKYKTKHLEASGVQLGYTDAEFDVLREEYRRRHPKSKL